MPVLGWPIIVARHLEVLPTLPAWEGVEVADGPVRKGTSNREWLSLGFITGEDAVTSWERTPDDQADGVVREDGNIGCELVCGTGSSDVAGRRARLAELLDAWQEWLAGDNTQGGALMANSRLQLSADISLELNKSGATASAVVAISYIARTA